MKHYLLLSAAALMLTVPYLSAHAEDSKAPAKTEKTAEKKAASPSGFGPVDANNDNVVTKAEADAAAVGEFGVFDADKDSKITKDEFKTVLYKLNAKALPNDEAKKKAEPMVMGRFNNLDTNKDGVISKDEFLADSTKRHKMFDENGDGKVTKAEVESMRTKIEKQIAALKAAAEKKSETVKK